MSKDDNQIPEIPEAVVLWLERTFPDRCPDAATSIEEVRALGGVQRVIRRLRLEYNRQNTRGEDTDE